MIEFHLNSIDANDFNVVMLIQVDVNANVKIALSTSLLLFSKIIKMVHE